MAKKVFIKTFGCQMNEYDSDKMADVLGAAEGFEKTQDPEEADLILIVQHDLFTKYVYTAIHKNTGIVVASGKLSSLGGTVAGKVAKRFLKQVVKARAMAPKTGS